MSKHTPGPWKVMPRINNFIDIEHSQNLVKGAITLALCRVQARQSWEDEAQANARLIAAAPDLLEALQGMVSAWNMVCDAQGWERDHIQQQKDACFAIAKATGEPT